MEDKKMKLSPPWIEYYRKLEAMFGPDPDIRVEFDEDEMHIKLYVESHEKATALDELLPVQKDFGNVSVFIEVIPANNEPKRIDYIKRALEGNPAFSYATTIEGIMSNPISYVVFKPEVIQIWSDNLSDVNGLTTTLMAEIAKEIIGQDDGIFYCTDKKE